MPMTRLNMKMKKKRKRKNQMEIKKKRKKRQKREKTMGHPILFTQRGCRMVHLYKIEWNFLLTYPVRMVK